MLKAQLQRYKKLRQSFSNPDEAVISSRGEGAKEFPFFSLNFEIKNNLSRKITVISEELDKKDPGHEYLAAPILHCTVKSLGLIGKQVALNQIPQVAAKLEAIINNFPSFEVELRGINNFKVALFIQVFSRDGKLFELHNLLNEALPYSEYPQLEGKEYTPHITIAYFRHRPIQLFNVMGEYSDVHIGKMMVDKLNLVSESFQPVAKKEIIKVFPLK